MSGNAYAERIAAAVRALAAAQEPPAAAIDVVADLASSRLPDVPPEQVGAALLCAGSAVGQLSMEMVARGTPLSGPAMFNLLMFAGERLYSRSSALREGDPVEARITIAQELPPQVESGVFAGWGVPTALVRLDDGRLVRVPSAQVQRVAARPAGDESQ